MQYALFFKLAPFSMLLMFLFCSIIETPTRLTINYQPAQERHDLSWLFGGFRTLEHIDLPEKTRLRIAVCLGSNGWLAWILFDFKVVFL